MTDFDDLIDEFARPKEDRRTMP